MGVGVGGGGGGGGGGSSARSLQENRVPTAFAQALKRVAAEAGVGRYLYLLRLGYMPFDPKRGRFVEKVKIEKDMLLKALRLSGFRLESVRNLRAKDPEGQVREVAESILEGRFIIPTRSLTNTNQNQQEV